MKKKLTKGSEVSWNYGKGQGHGKIVKQANSRTTIKSHNKTITRNGTQDNPAYTIEQENGGKVLKLSSELKKGG